MAQYTNDNLIRMLNDKDANEIGDGGTSYAEGDGYECVISFKYGMKAVELKRLCSGYGAHVGGPKYYAVNLILRLFLYHFLHTMSL